MKNKILLTGIAATWLAALNALATFDITWTSGFANGGMVTDNGTNGWVDTRTITTAPAGTIQNLAVNLQLQGGHNGDLYAYLTSGSGFSVLLNQITGTGQNGMNVTLTTGDWLGAPANNGSIHGYTGTGQVWSPDTTAPGPNGSPLGDWSSFNGLPANNTWTLFIADRSSGDISTVQSWGLQMDIVAVPEVETWIAAAFAGAFGAFWLNRQIMVGVKDAQ